jgi:hypothetical protein
MDEVLVLISAVNYLLEGGDEDAAKVLSVCTLSYRVINFYYQIGGEDKIDGVLLDLACPRVGHGVLKNHAHPITKAILGAIKAWLPTDYTYENLVVQVEYTDLDPTLRSKLLTIT